MVNDNICGHYIAEYIDSNLKVGQAVVHLPPAHMQATLILYR